MILKARFAGLFRSYAEMVGKVFNRLNGAVGRISSNEMSKNPLIISISVCNGSAMFS